MKTLLLLLLLAPVISCNNMTTAKNDPSKAGAEGVAVDKKTALKRPAYQMEYADDWKMDSTDKDFSLDSYFTFNSASDNGFISFFIFNTSIDEKTFVDKQIEENLKKTLKNGKVTYFTDWGKYKGKGAIISGKLLGLYSGEVRTFAHSGDSCSFLIVSQVLNSDKAQDEPGLKLIESSFKLTQ